MMKSPLFDAVPLFRGPALYSESRFDFLNRADGPEWASIRGLLEDWYSSHPDPSGGLRARFREKSIKQHAGAWWELYIHELFSRLGYSLTVDPEIRDPSDPSRIKVPDFLVRRGDSEILVECAVLFKDGSTKRSDSDQWLLDCIDAARNPDFMVSVRINVASSRRVKKLRVTREIETWLSGLDYEAVRQVNDGAALPSHEFSFGDDTLRLTLRALPVKPDCRGIEGGRLGVGPSSSAFPISSTKEIRKIVKGKREQFVAEGTAAVVAILTEAMFATNREFEDALFGSAMVRVRAEDGYFHPGPPPRGGGVSAVLFGDGISMPRPMRALPTLWINPWARKDLPFILPFQTYTARDTGEVFKCADATASSETVFGMPPEWPWTDSCDG